MARDTLPQTRQRSYRSLFEYLQTQPWRYIDVIRTKRGKLRTWNGHEKAMKDADKVPSSFTTFKWGDNE